MPIPPGAYSPVKFGEDDWIPHPQGATINGQDDQGYMWSDGVRRQYVGKKP